MPAGIIVDGVLLAMIGLARVLTMERQCIWN
jgi:hypothetical protein